jgi:hypothetical protein
VRPSGSGAISHGRVRRHPADAAKPTNVTAVVTSGDATAR